VYTDIYRRFGGTENLRTVLTLIRSELLTGWLERILTMVYVVQSYWACFGLYPSSCK
jgi:hypothetical protein